MPLLISRNRWLFKLAIGILLLGLLVADAIWAHHRRHQSDDFSFGVSFSVKYAKELGLDWRTAYLAILDDLGVKQVRLMSYWDQVEAERSNFDYADLDWQFDQAARRGSKVSLAVGLRQPRYPECHFPGWYTNLDNDARVQALDGFLVRIIERYKDHPALTSWQLENEALNEGFGECRSTTNRRLKQEYKLIKRRDSVHPVIFNLSDEVGLPIRQPRGDLVGISVYKRYWEGNTKRYITYPFAPWWHRLKAAMIERHLGRPVFIHELQAEPWGPKSTQDLSLAEQDQTMNAAKLGEMIVYAKATGIKQVDLWGAEWWYWRKIHGDESVWIVAKEVYAD